MSFSIDFISLYLSLYVSFVNCTTSDCLNVPVRFNRRDTKNIFSDGRCSKVILQMDQAGLAMGLVDFRKSGDEFEPDLLHMLYQNPL